jgi:hypothetical protein
MKVHAFFDAEEHEGTVEVEAGDLIEVEATDRMPSLAKVLRLYPDLRCIVIVDASVYGLPVSGAQVRLIRDQGVVRVFSRDQLLRAREIGHISRLRGATIHDQPYADSDGELAEAWLDAFLDK